MRADLRKPKEKQYSVKDNVVRGLELVVYPSGKKSWKLRRTLPGKGRRVQFSIGDANETSLTDARKRAEAWIARIANGEDPTAPSEQTLKLRLLWETYLTEHAKVHKRSWKDDVSLWDRWVKPLANTNVRELTRRDVSKFHKSIGATNKVRANRALSLLSAMCSFAVEQDWLEENPCFGIRRFPEKSRERFIPESELKSFLKLIEAHPTPWFRDMIKLSLMTGQRLSNVLTMRWDELTLPEGEGSGVWVIPEDKFKNGDSMHATLTSQAVEVIRGRENRSPWVFPSSGSKTGHRVNPHKNWDKFREDHNLGDLRIHDLRRSFGSLLAAKGVSLQIIGKALGHRSLQTTRIYARLQDSTVQTAVSDAVGEI